MIWDDSYLNFGGKHILYIKLIIRLESGYFEVEFLKMVLYQYQLWVRVRVMVFNTTFNYILAIISCINYEFIVRKDSSTSEKRCFSPYQLIYSLFCYKL
jgi:hypothetical protein